MKKTMQYICFVLIALTLVACSSTNKGSENEAKDKEVKSEPTTRIVKDAYGDVTIPTEPKNMLVLRSNYAENLIEIGVTPQMVTVIEEIEPEYRPKLFKDNNVKIIPTVQYEDNLEVILEAAPDVIIAEGAAIDAKKYEALSKIAPTVAVEAGVAIDEYVPVLGKLFNKEKEAELALKKFNEKIEDTKKKLHNAIGDEKILVLRVEQKQYRVLGTEKGSPGSDMLYTKLGLNIPTKLKDNKDWFTPISLEVLPEIEADHIFVEQRTMQNYSSEQSMKDLENSTMWKEMAAVKAGNVYPLKTADYVVGEGLIGSPLFLDYLVEKLVR
ncbi:ABC transporter substrate-binding protein [Paenibacillus sp. ACRRX]|uniref:ABC transporter substrate-binding protein n=1 Tax=unclassified Paenibacillus TaxID=185978 RepID=UPI001EF6113C|nr:MULTISPECIES: ABC transporter substrate-binding protein [unclassified Paenibacillus]MCG7408336.1 ABC transporter substrate-binding protein [Paenibacillus sp. ACRRX]MDK8181279.1 ABC transporter substrate-binding protein [Paenibacillus sp. UMB4589-SE434]